MNPMLQEIMMRQYGLANQGAGQLLDFEGRSDEYRRNALQEGARSAESLGGQIAQRTGNEYSRDQVALGMANDATSDANAFQRFLYGPQGRSEAYAGAQGLYNAPFQSGMGIANLAQGDRALDLQRFGIMKQYQKPTVWESLGGSVLGSLPGILQNSSIFKRPTPKPVQGAGIMPGENDLSRLRKPPTTGGLWTEYKGFK